MKETMSLKDEMILTCESMGRLTYSKAVSKLKLFMLDRGSVRERRAFRAVLNYLQHDFHNLTQTGSKQREMLEIIKKVKNDVNVPKLNYCPQVKKSFIVLNHTEYVPDVKLVRVDYEVVEKQKQKIKVRELIPMDDAAKISKTITSCKIFDRKLWAGAYTSGKQCLPGVVFYRITNSLRCTPSESSARVFNELPKSIKDILARYQYSNSKKSKLTEIMSKHPHLFTEQSTYRTVEKEKMVDVIVKKFKTDLVEYDRLETNVNYIKDVTLDLDDVTNVIYDLSSMPGFSIIKEHVNGNFFYRNLFRSKTDAYQLTDDTEGKARIRKMRLAQNKLKKQKPKEMSDEEFKKVLKEFVVTMEKKDIFQKPSILLEKNARKWLGNKTAKLLNKIVISCITGYNVYDGLFRIYDRYNEVLRRRKLKQMSKIFRHQSDYDSGSDQYDEEFRNFEFDY